MRQSNSLISQRLRGASARMPSPLPAETTAAAMPRRSLEPLDREHGERHVEGAHARAHQEPEGHVELPDLLT